MNSMIEKLSHHYYNRGLEEARAQQPAAAVQSLARAISFDRSNIGAWNLAGLCYYRLGSYETARYCWTRSLELQPGENGATAYLLQLENDLAGTAPHFSRVASLGAAKKYKEAAAILNKEICSCFDPSVALLNYLGVLHLLARRPGRAAKCWTTVLTMDKDNPAASQYLETLEKSPAYRMLIWKERLLNKLRGKEKGLGVG